MKDLATFYGEDKTYVFKGKINLQEAAIDKQVTMNEWRNLKSIIFQRRKAHCEKMDGKISKSQSQDETKELQKQSLCSAKKLFTIQDIYPKCLQLLHFFMIFAISASNVSSPTRNSPKHN